MMSAQAKHIYEFGPFRLIPSERHLLRDNQPVSMTPKTFDLLVLLVENGGHLLQKEVLLKRIWPDSYVEEANLSVNMSALRRALGEGPEDHRYVETVPRHGYRFVAEVKELWENGAEIAATRGGENTFAHIPGRDSSASIALPTTASRPHRSRRRWQLVAVGLLLIAGSIVALNMNRVRDWMRGNTTPLRVQSLAVLPLENASGDV